MQVDARSSYLGQTLNFVSFPPIFILTSVLQEEKINYLNFLQIQNNLQFRAYVLSTPGFDWKSKKNLKAKKKRKVTIIRRLFLIRSFVDLCSSSHHHCGSSSFNSHRPLNITSREAPRTIIFVREHANVSTITTVHSRVLHRLQRCTRLSRRPWSLESENYVQNVLRPFSSILFLFLFFFFFFFFFLSSPPSRFRYPSVVRRVVNRLIISNPEAELELIKNNRAFLSSSFYFP